jgi:hypothetical protein
MARAKQATLTNKTGGLVSITTEPDSEDRSELVVKAQKNAEAPMSIHGMKSTHEMFDHELRTHSPGNQYLVGKVDGRLIASSKLLNMTETRAETTRAIYLLKGKSNVTRTK